MPILQAAIFDLDGTLLDSAPDIRNALNLTLTSHRRRHVTLDEVKAMVGDGLLTTLERAFTITGAPIPSAESYIHFQEFIEHYRAQKPDPAQLYPDAIATMQKFLKTGVKLGICTNKQEASTLRLLDQLNVARYFNFVAGGDTFQVHKPNPGHVTGVLEKLNVSPINAVMIGDSRNDALAARGAGVACLIVKHGYGTDFSNLEIDGLIDGFADLDATLERLGFRQS